MSIHVVEHLSGAAQCLHGDVLARRGRSNPRGPICGWDLWRVREEPGYYPAVADHCFVHDSLPGAVVSGEQVHRVPGWASKALRELEVARV